MTQSQQHADSFQLDDTFAVVCQDIITNGFDDSTLPHSIKSWVIEKFYKSLPKKITNRLLRYLLEHRDITECILLKDDSDGNLDQFTITIHKTKKSQNKNLYKQVELDTTPLEVALFDPAKDNVGNLEDFYEHEFTVEQRQIVPKLVAASLGSNIAICETLQAKKMKHVPDKEVEVSRKYTKRKHQWPGNKSEVDPGISEKLKTKIKYKYGKKKGREKIFQENDEEFDYRIYSDEVDDFGNDEGDGGQEEGGASKKLKDGDGKVLPLLKTRVMESTEDLIKKAKQYEEIIEELDPITGKMAYTCIACDQYKLKRISYIIKHVENVHKKMKKFSCNLCGRAFSQKGTLLSHMRVHDEVYDFPCRYCDKKFKWSETRKTHEQRLHKTEYVQREYDEKMAKIKYKKEQEEYFEKCKVAGIKPFNCPECSFSTAFKKSLVRHLNLIHTGVKIDPFYLNKEVVWKQEWENYCILSGQNF